MMQLNLINPVVKHAKTFKRTKKNIALMKQCFCEGNKKGWVSDELWNEVKNKEYKTNQGLINKKLYSTLNKV